MFPNILKSFSTFFYNCNKEMRKDMFSNSLFQSSLTTRRLEFGWFCDVLRPYKNISLLYSRHCCLQWTTNVRPLLGVYQLQVCSFPVITSWDCVQLLWTCSQVRTGLRMGGGFFVRGRGALSCHPFCNTKPWFIRPHPWIDSPSLSRPLRRIVNVEMDN